MLKNKKGITLIALVVTIVVLLILAGVTISLLLDENGIIAKSKDARIGTRASQVEDEVGMWKQHNFINKESNQAQENADTMLANLISRKLLTEDEIDRNQELITIKKKDGTVIKEISYGNVTINISKTPETEKSGAVALTATVTGTTIPNIDMSNGEEELNNWMNSLTEEEKKEIIRQMLPKSVNKIYNATEYDTLEKAIVKLNEEQEIPETINKEEDLWNLLKKENGFDLFLMEFCIGPLCYNKDTKIVKGYTVTNPDNKTSNEYRATENGTYTFKIQELVTGKTYTKKVEVTNIDENAKYYVTNIKESDINNNTAKVITKLATRQSIKIALYRPYWCVALRDKETNTLQTFTTAYIIYNNQKIDISSLISEKNGYSYILGNNIGNYLNNNLESFDKNEFYGSIQQFIIEKDGTEFRGYAKVCEEE